MKSFPQLRVKTGFSFKRAYGRLKQVKQRLDEVGSDIFCIVDRNTFGHVSLESELGNDIITAYGVEVPIKDESKYRPNAWMLAVDLKKFYNCSTFSARNDGVLPEEFETFEGVIRFSGGALHLLEDDQFDYIDINPASFVAAQKAVQRHRESGKPMIITSNNTMPSLDSMRYACSWKVGEPVGIWTIERPETMWEKVFRYVMTKEEFGEAIKNTYKVADLIYKGELRKAPLIHLDGDLVELARQGQRERLAKGHIKEWTDEYEERFQLEIKTIQDKKFDSYFLVVADLIDYAKKHMLVGPGRGSSCGSLICYLIRITEIDPIPYKLLFYRFIDVSRSDFPDIDIDFADNKRYMVFDYLQEKYGIENVARLANVSTLKPASVLKQVGERFGIPEKETDAVKNAILEYSSADERYGKGLEDTLSKTSPGQHFTEKHEIAADAIGDLELHPSHSGVHAAGILVCNDEVQDYCTVMADGVAQINKYDAEHLNLLKIDALGLRTLGVIEDTGCVTADELYGLKFDDPVVFDVMNQGKMSGIFQFEGRTARSVADVVHIDCFDKIDNITALARPGPLGSGMWIHYIERAAGREETTYDVPQLEKYLKDTFGIFLYQEQIMSVVKEIGDFDWEKTSAIRKGMAKSKGEEFFNSMAPDFIKGAAHHGIPEDKALSIWNNMVAFGAWGFNKSHSCAYAAITYWTAYMKAYYYIEYAAACLRSAKDEAQTIQILKELAEEGIGYDPIDIEHSDVNWAAVNGRLVGGIMNAIGFGPVKAAQYVERRNAGTLTEAQKEKLLNAEVKFSDLEEAHTKFGHYYEDPSLIGVTGGKPIKNIEDIPMGKTGICIGKMVKKTVSDMNEAVRIKKRGGKMIKGQSTFIDIFLVDDSTDASKRFRIGHRDYIKMGLRIAEETPKGTWFLVKARRLDNIDMFYIMAIKEIHETSRKETEV